MTSGNTPFADGCAWSADLSDDTNFNRQWCMKSPSRVTPLQIRNKPVCVQPVVIRRQMPSKWAKSRANGRAAAGKTGNDSGGDRTRNVSRGFRNFGHAPGAFEVLQPN